MPSKRSPVPGEHPLKVAGGVTLDWRLWPVLVVTPPARNITDAELMQFMTLWDRIVCSSPASYSIVLDLRDAARMPPAQRKLLTDTMTSSQQELNDYCRGAAMVFSSALLRGMLTAVFWVFKPEYPTRVFASVEEAIVWAQDVLDDPQVVTA